MDASNIQLFITFTILIVAIVLFFLNKIAPDLTALLTVVALTATGILTPQEAFSGFSRSAVITILAIFIIAEALRRSGVTEQVGNILLRIAGSREVNLIAATMVSGAILSIFMNNIAAAAVLLPAVSGAAKKANVHISKLLMPLAFSTTLGGMATLFATSNIVLSSVLIENNYRGFGILDFAPVGIPLVFAGISYVTFIGRRFLPSDSMLERTQAPSASQQTDLIETYHLGKNLFRARVPKNSSLIDKRIADSTLREDFSVSIVAIERDGKRMVSVSPETILKESDILVLEGDEEDFRKRDVEPYMEFLPSPEWHKEHFQSQIIDIVEAIIAPRSRLIDQTLRSAHFREKYGMTVLAIWRANEEIFIDLQDVPLQFGDALLLQGPRERLVVLRDNPDLIVLMSKESAEITVPGKGRAALIIFIVTLILAVIFPDLTSTIVLGGALAMMLAGILSTEQAYSAIGWKTVFMVAGVLPIGIALTKTNAAGMMASGVVATLGDFGPLAMFAGLFIVTVFSAQLMSSVAVAAVIGPIAIQIAQQMNINPRSLVMGVAMASAMAFITPLSHPVNILVMSPGGYSFRDYMKIGIPLTAILFVVVMILLPLVWKF
jgi:di/tricarboxylate transporter